jgi:hypothetical protein
LEPETYFDSGDSFHVRGRVYNQTGETRTFVKVVVTMYDSAGQIIGADYAYIAPDSLPPGQDSAFDVEVSAWKGRPDRTQVALYLAIAVDD